MVDRTHPEGLRYPHGTWLAYVHRPCRCGRCLRAWKVYQQQLLSRHRRGQVWADLTRAQQALAPFVAALVTPTAIAEAAGGMKSSQVRSILAGGHIKPATAARVERLTWDDLPDTVRVDADLLRALVDELRDRGWTWVQLAERFGWVGWPHGGYPRGTRAALGLVRNLERAVGRVEHGGQSAECEDCGDVPLAGGRWCLPCFQDRSLPQTRRDIGQAARRERMRVQRARYGRGAAA